MLLTRPPVCVGLAVVLLGTGGSDVAAAPPDERTGGPQARTRGEICIATGLAGHGLDELIRDAVAVLRQSGYDPDDYRLDLTMERSAEVGLADWDGKRQAAVVFVPVAGRDLHPLRVGPSSPCHASWVWTPERFTAWQRGVIERARDVLRDTWPAHAGETLSGVQVIESATEVRVRLSLGESDASGRAPSTAEITIRKSDLSAED